MAKETAKKAKVLYEKRGRTAIITINRPEAMNAYDTETGQLIEKYESAAMADPEVWTVILTGAGDKAFCAGLDLKMVDRRIGEGGPAVSKGAVLDGGAIQSPYFYAIRGAYSYPHPTNKPMIAAINGYCVGGGLEQAMTCDIRIAADHARFQCAESKRGMIAGITPAKLPRLIPFNLALELLLTCEMIDAKEAYRIGLVNKVVPLKDLMPTALAMCDKINENAPLGIRSAKIIAWNGMDMSLRDTLQHNHQVLHEVLYQTEDYKEGVRAFVEKRKPVWKAR
jgi:enoyl-CoA hydratase/carnithine racemase